MVVSSTNYDFAGWATRANLKCTDGRTILRDAFKHNDGRTVPLVWNHRHQEPYDVLGHALLENRDEGVYAYCAFNDTENGQLAKTLVQHGDITALSIYANQLKQQGGNVMHGEIREVSLVHAGANPGAFIDSVIKHSDDGDPVVMEDEGVIYTGETFSLYHADNGDKEDDTVAEEKKIEGGEKTIGEIIDTMNDDQKTAMYALIGQALEDNGADEDDNEEDNDMKHNVFDNDTQERGNVLSHADQQAIIAMAKQSNVGSLKQAIQIYAEENDILQHSDDGVGVFEDYGVLFPELELPFTGCERRNCRG